EFNYLDRNRDGRLNRYEVVGSNASSTVYDEFRDLDYNRDNRIARNEWHWSNSSFNQRDTNRDGVITAQEFANAGAAPGTIGAIAGQPSAANQQIRVNSQTRWTDTGITVRQGDIIRFDASGQIQMSDNGSDMAGTAGSLNRRMAQDAPISGVFAGALIGKIGA